MTTTTTTASHAGCDHQVANAAQSFADSVCREPASAKRQWCNMNQENTVLHPWTGFFGIWLGFYRAEQTLAMARHMYEWRPKDTGGGNYQHRWTDQALFLKYLCMWEDVAEFAHLESNKSQGQVAGVCNSYGAWQDDIFFHQSEPASARTQAEYESHVAKS